VEVRVPRTILGHAGHGEIGPADGQDPAHRVGAAETPLGAERVRMTRLGPARAVLGSPMTSGKEKTTKKSWSAA